MDAWIQRQYDRWAKTYDWLWRRYTSKTLAVLKEWVHVGPEDEVLDVGCGTEAFEWRLLAGHSHQGMVGVDLSEKYAHSSSQEEPSRFCLHADA